MVLTQFFHTVLDVTLQASNFHISEGVTLDLCVDTGNQFIDRRISLTLIATNDTAIGTIIARTISNIIFIGGNNL